MYGTRIYECVCRLNSSIRRLYYFYLNNQEAIEFTNNKAGGERDEEAESKGEMESDVRATGKKSPRKFNSGL